MGLVFPGGAVVKNLPAKRETQETWGLQGSLEERTATHSSISAWKIPWKEESYGLQSVGHKELGMTEQMSTHLWDYSALRFPQDNTQHALLLTQLECYAITEIWFLHIFFKEKFL